MTRPSLRLTPSLVIAAAALFVALGGTSWAAQLVTSASIKNGTIQTKDLSKKARKALTGERGPRGHTGKTGARGPAGAAGMAGAVGKTGSAGATGAKGSTGANGKDATPGRIAQAVDDSGSGIAIAGFAPTKLVAVTIAVPDGVGFVHLTANTSFNQAASATDDRIWLIEGATCGSTINRAAAGFGHLTGDGDQQVTSAQGVFGVTAGSHTYSMCAASDVDTHAFSSILVATTVAAGAAG